MGRRLRFLRNGPWSVIPFECDRARDGRSHARRHRVAVDINAGCQDLEVPLVWEVMATVWCRHEQFRWREIREVAREINAGPPRQDRIRAMIDRNRDIEHDAS